MSQQVINVGTEPDDGTGDSTAVAFQKINANFAELYVSYQLETTEGDA